ncbi:BTB/POZ domain-containing protein 6 [Halotydeus destructor]|nr:BTB/POZ domain-containing protein 6 [Halotydeus destructor]
MTILNNVGPGTHPVDRDIPSAPSPGLVLFNTEEQSDIVFNVGTDQDVLGGGKSVWRFPAHSFILAEASPVFADIIRTQLDHYGSMMSGNKPEIFIHCQPEIFHIVLSYIYKKEVNISTVSNCLSLVVVSSQFMLHELCRTCLTFLVQKANASNVLEILSWLKRVAPSSANMDDGTQNAAETVLVDLSAKCYSLLDANAEKILRSEATDNLEQEMLIEVLSRDTLRLDSELTAFECLMNWACQQCLKRRLELVGENKRHVLGKAVYSARYLVMTLDEFLKGPYSSDLLTDEEKSAILSVLKGSAKPLLPMHLAGHKLDIVRKFVIPTGFVSPTPRKVTSVAKLPSPTGKPSTSMAVANRKKNSASKKLLNGLSGIMICVIQLLD